MPHIVACLVEVAATVIAITTMVILSASRNALVSSQPVIILWVAAHRLSTAFLAIRHVVKAAAISLAFRNIPRRVALTAACSVPCMNVFRRARMIRSAALTPQAHLARLHPTIITRRALSLVSVVWLPINVFPFQIRLSAQPPLAASTVDPLATRLRHRALALIRLLVGRTRLALGLRAAM